jgi:hypothetical protein
VSNSPTGNDEFDQQVRPRGEPSTRLVEESVNGLRRFLYVVIAIFTFTALGFSSASSFYITRDGAGSMNGSSLANAAACDSTPGAAQGACAAFDNSSNWGSGSNQIGPGTVVHVGDDGVTITATAGASQYFAFQAGGSSGNPITLRLATTVSAPYWCCQLGGAAINLEGKSYLIVDGTVPCGWNTATNASEGACVGIIQATANGDGMQYQQESTAISSSSCSNVEIKNLGIYNMYVKSDVTKGGPSDSMNIFCDGDSAGVLIHDNAMHDAESQIVMVPFTNANSNWAFYNNDLYHMNWGIIEGAGGSVTITTVNVYGNHIHDMSNWDVNSNQYHHDGMYFYYASGTQTIVNLSVYNNIFDGQESQPSTGSAMTAYIFMDPTDILTNALFYNNVVLMTDPQVNGGDPMFNLGIASGNAGLYNNTFICSYAGAGPGGFENDQHSGTATFTAENNLVINCNRFVNFTGTFSSTGFNNNVYANSNSGNQWEYNNNNFYAALSQWQSGTGQDKSAQYTTGGARLGGAYENDSESPVPGIIPQSNSVAVGAGANLTGLGIATLDVDITGAARAQSGSCTPGTPGCWDAGALQYSSGNTPPNPPTGLTAVVQ